MQRWLLSRVFYDDLAVTRTDRSYLGTLFGDARTAATANCFVHVRPCDAGADMSFNLAAYQPGARGIQQTSFLKAAKEDAWTRSAIHPDKVCMQQWLRQFADTRRHFLAGTPSNALFRTQTATQVAAVHSCMLLNTLE